MRFARLATIWSAWRTTADRGGRWAAWRCSGRRSAWRWAWPCGAPGRARPAPSAPAWLSGDLPAANSRPVQAPPILLAQRIEQLAASGTPQDAWRAWWLLHACAAFARDGRLPHDDGADDGGPREPVADPARFCAGMTERMRMARIDYLERAARGGVEGALAALVEEGPFGDPDALRTRPDDPLVQEWKARVNGLLAQRAEQGSWSSLYLQFTGFWFENPAITADRQSALAYGMALRDILVGLDGLSEQDAIPFNGPFLDAVAQGLAPAQVALARAQAARIVARAAAQRGRRRE